MALFSFTLDTAQIADTRSLHEDTDYASFTLLVEGKNGKGTPRTLTKAMGNVNNGTHKLELSFLNVPVEPGETAVVNYLVVNSSHKRASAVEAILEKAGGKLATGPGGALGAIAAWLASDLAAIFSGRCDGLVAAEKDSFTYDDLLAKTAKNAFKKSTKHPGTDSATGCGGNSVYIVNWEAAHTGSDANTTVPNVLSLSAGSALERLRAAGLVAKYTGHPAIHSSVVSQFPGAGSRVDAGSSIALVFSN